MTDPAMVPARKTPGELFDPQAMPAESDMVRLLRLAVESKADIGTVERIEAMHEREQARQAKAAYLDAFRRFQASCPPVHKARTNPATRSRYANLDDVIATVTPHLSAAGLSVSFYQRLEGDKWLTVCRLTHVDGHYEESAFPLFQSQQNKATTEIQSMGSSLTYAKRYALCALLGVATSDEDVDGNAGKPAPVAEVIGEAECIWLTEWLETAPTPEDQRKWLAWLLKSCGVDAITSITRPAFEQAKRTISERKKGGGK